MEENMRIRQWTYTALLLIGFAALMPGFLRSQQNITPGAETDELPSLTIGVDVSMVSVPVTVRNADGSLFKGLTQNPSEYWKTAKRRK